MTDKFDIILVGDEAELSHLITEDDVITFARLTGDDNPLHVNAEYAAETTFRRPVVHGMLTASFISTMIGTKLPGEGSLWYEQQMRFVSPVRIGENIRVWAKVKHKSIAQRVVVLETVVFGEDGRRVIEGEAKVKVTLQQKEKGVVMTKDLKGAVIVSGGSRGIGAAISKALAAEGYFVAINYLKGEQQARKLEQEIKESGGRAAIYGVDICDQTAVERMVELIVADGSIFSGIVNNASGPIHPVDFAELRWSEMQQHIDIQLKGAFNLSRSVLPHLVAQKKGHILNIASIYADNVPPTKLLPYNTVKAALVAFSKSLAVDYGPLGIRVNCISPGMTMTDLLANVPEKSKMLTKMQTPLRRLAVPDDVAGLAAFLFNDRASFITGQNISVCGGISM
jgi:3-oxoacyl-[acyl-carrier protein] reductase